MSETNIPEQRHQGATAEASQDHNGSGETRANLPQKRTPLPKLQLFIVFLIQFAEPLTATVIYPFVNQFVRDTGITGGDESKTGYYAGIVGAFNGNIGVSKSVLGEITDSTNLADVYAMMPLTWSFGATIGPIIGGLFAQPAKTWPDLFGNIFFYQYPYFLPCAVASLLAFVPAIIAFIGLKETLPSAVFKEKKRQAAAATSNNANIKTALLNDSGTDSTTYGATGSNIAGGALEELPHEVPLPFRALLTRRVLTTLMVHGFLCVVDMSCMVLQPLVYSTSVPLGGLGFSAYQIGVVMGTWGVINAVVQFTCLAPMLRKLGARKVQSMSQLSYAVVFALCPLLSYFAKRAGKADGLVWMVITIQLLFALLNYPAFASIQILILESSPNRASLGSTNGMAQAVGSIMRSIAPSLASSLYSISIQKQVLGGNMVFLFFSITALVGFRLTLLLPK
ncbi:hypothetical protein H0H81_011510 [Sphagnurus paluster]|uniref:Major facilitator superfamily (MFS) profile domain-containing protein n=1 Tax=Sphagnurus paluster TaxID=117069 RepID=A0A9P7GLC7_9AGAR|nr:hypothetical protein H0H81_011510 [Sphagnurus paluster]